MKRVITILFILLSYNLFGQQVNITGLTVKPELPGNINNWGPDAVNAIAIGSAQTRPDAKFKMVIQVRSGNGTVCGNTPQTAQLIDNFNTKVLRTADITSILDPCLLHPGQYNLCIQFYNEDLRAVSEQCRPFMIREENMNCAAPQNITPSNELMYTEQQLLLPIIFRWTPMISSNRNLVVYHFTLWEVEEGETVSQAIYNSLPIFEQDVRGQTQFILRPGILEKRSGTYAWRIEAFDEQGKPFCKENYISAATSFSYEVKKQEKESNCIDFEHSTSTRNWYSFFVDEIRITTNPLDMVNRTTMLKLKDGSGGSNAINNVEFSGNWLERGCLCFDYKVDYNPKVDKDCPETNKAGNAVNLSIYTGPAITDINSLINSVRAIYVMNADQPKIEDDVWKKYCLPIALCKNGNLPSDGKGHWQIHKNGVVITRAEACTEWDKLIRNITGVIFSTDYNCEPSEIVYFDNFCWGCPEIIPPTKDSTTTPPVTDSICNYCIDSLKINIGAQTLSVAADLLNLSQTFSISPINISKVSAEIIYIKEDPLIPSCFECLPDQSQIGNFVPVNTSSWNSGPLLNGSPVTSSGYFPSKRVIWFCNQQGNLKINLKLALPGMTNAACKRKGKVCIRFSFTDANCKTCDRIICFNYSE